MFDIGTFSGQLDLIERRRVSRRLFREQAKLLCRDDDDLLDCLIRDQTPEGAGVAIFGRASFPSSVLLGVKDGSTVFEATPIRLDRLHLGLRFVRAFDLATCDTKIRSRLLRVMVD